jgi:hypothetical protein
MITLHWAWIAAAFFGWQITLIVTAWAAAPLVVLSPISFDKEMGLPAANGQDMSLQEIPLPHLYDFKPVG